MEKQFHLHFIIIFFVAACYPLFSSTNPFFNLTDSTGINTAELIEENGYFTLQKGTTVTLRLVEDVRSSGVDQGNSVALEVYTDVIVDGKVLIATGTYAEGEIIKKRRPGIFGRGAVIHLNATNLRSVDGQRVGLRSKGIMKTGGNRTVFACGVSTIVPVVGLVMANPWFVPLAATGLFIRGKEAEIQKGTTFTAYISEDIRIKV